MTWHTVRFLAEARAAGLELGRTVTIGRQNCDVSGPRILQILADHRIEVPPGLISLPHGPKYAEPVLLSLGATQVESIDNSSYESASAIWDLNRAVPSDWHERYELLYDGGSLEHIFNVPQALANYMQMVRVGGHVLVHTMANNWCGHGFYQLSPELFYRALSPDNGFRVERMVVFESYEHAPTYDVPDPVSIRSRIELSNAWVGVDLIVLARREARVVPFARWPQQSDYAVRWASFSSAPVPPSNPSPAPTAAPSFRRRWIERAKDAFPALVGWKHWLLYRAPALTRAWRRWRTVAYHKTHSFRAQPDRYASK